MAAGEVSEEYELSFLLEDGCAFSNLDDLAETLCAELDISIKPKSKKKKTIHLFFASNGQTYVRAKFYSKKSKLMVLVEEKVFQKKFKEERPIEKMWIEDLATCLREQFNLYGSVHSLLLKNSVKCIPEKSVNNSGIHFLRLDRIERMLGGQAASVHFEIEYSEHGGIDQLRQRILRNPEKLSIVRPLQGQEKFGFGRLETPMADAGELSDVIRRELLCKR